MSELCVENKQVVAPGSILAKGIDYLPGVGAYRCNDTIIANRVGLVCIEGRAIKLIPLAGKYYPKEGDVIIGRVTDVTMNGWRLDINCAYSSMLSLKEATSDYIEKGEDLSNIIPFDAYVVCKVIMVSSQKLIDLNTRGPGLHQLHGGQVIKVSPCKVPRIIGKQGSMMYMIKKS